MAFGGPGDGLYVGASDGSNLARRSDVQPTALTWTPQGLYASADAKLAGFSIGRSLDSGATFQGLFKYESICGQTACSGTATSACAAQWEMVALQLVRLAAPRMRVERTRPPMRNPAAVLRTFRAAPAASRAEEARAAASFLTCTARRMHGRGWLRSSPCFGGDAAPVITPSRSVRGLGENGSTNPSVGDLPLSADR